MLEPILIVSARIKGLEFTSSPAKGLTTDSSIPSSSVQVHTPRSLYTRAFPAAKVGLGLGGVWAKKWFPATKASPGRWWDPADWVGPRARLTSACRYSALFHMARAGVSDQIFSSNPTAANFCAIKK
ncbi:unnamed protein product [Prunus armeniaca]